MAPPSDHMPLLLGSLKLSTTTLQADEEAKLEPGLFDKVEAFQARETKKSGSSDEVQSSGEACRC